MTENFQAVKIDAVPGVTILRLTKEWDGLAAGTDVSPLWAGHDNVRDEHLRTVAVQSGPRKGEQVTGKF